MYLLYCSKDMSVSNNYSLLPDGSKNEVLIFRSVRIIVIAPAKTGLNYLIWFKSDTLIDKCIEKSASVKNIRMPFYIILSILFVCRCIFLDPTCPKFSVSSPFYHNQLILGLSVNIWAHHAWGSYFTINLDLKSLHFSETKQAVITR